MKQEHEELLRSLDGAASSQDDPSGLCACAAPVIRELTDEQERGWLIETAQQTYWVDGVYPNARFSQDTYAAVRFSRFEDAEQVRCYLLEMPHGTQVLRSVEHTFPTEGPDTS